MYNFIYSCNIQHPYRTYNVADFCYLYICPFKITWIQNLLTGPTWWRLFQVCVTHTNLDIYLFIIWKQHNRIKLEPHFKMMISQNLQMSATQANSMSKGLGLRLWMCLMSLSTIFQSNCGSEVLLVEETI
jgi:hypothetical protein